MQILEEYPKEFSDRFYPHQPLNKTTKPRAINKVNLNFAFCIIFLVQFFKISYFFVVFRISKIRKNVWQTILNLMRL